MRRANRPSPRAMRSFRSSSGVSSWGTEQDSWASALEPRQQARCVPPLATQFLDLGIERVDQGCDWKAGAVSPCFGQTDRQILAHPFDREAEIEFGLVHGLVGVLHRPGLGGALRNGVDDGLDVEPLFFREMDSFRQAFD